jgi:hypothetical protein
LYVIGIPLSIFTVLLHGVRHDCLSDPRWLNVLGYYYKKYKTEYWYWELVILLRRFSFSFVSVTLQKEAYVQCGIGCVLCLSAMLAQFTCRPFIEDGLNSLDCLCTFSVLLYIIGGIFFLNDSLPEWNRQVYAWLIVVVNAAEVTLCGYLAISLARQRHLVDKVAGTLTLHLINEGRTIGRTLASELERKRDELQAMCSGAGEVVFVSQDKTSCIVRFESGEERELTTTHLMRDYQLRGVPAAKARIVCVPNGLKVFHPEEHGVPLEAFLRVLGGDEIVTQAFFFLADVQKNHILELEEIQKIFEVFQNDRHEPSVDGLKRVLSSKVNPGLSPAASGRRVSTFKEARKLLRDTERALFENAKSSVDRLSEALEPAALRRWLFASERTSKELATFLCSGEWLAPSLGDEAPASAYSRHPVAHLFRGLVHGQPWLIDAIGQLPEHSVKALREIFTLLESFAENMGRYEPLHHVIAHHARPGVLHWLIHHAEGRQRELFSAVLQSMCKSSHVGHVPHVQELTKHLQLDVTRSVSGRVHVAPGNPSDTAPSADSSGTQSALPVKGSEAEVPSSIPAPVGSAPLAVPPEESGHEPPTADRLPRPAYTQPQPGLHDAVPAVPSHSTLGTESVADGIHHGSFEINIGE